MARLEWQKAGYGLLGLQLVGMLVFSTVQYRRFALTADYAQYAQVWYLIAHGHLDPHDSVFHIAFWRNNGEFVMWPLALLYYLNPHTIDLLWLQDIAVVATEVVAFHWALEVIDDRAPGLSTSARNLATVAVPVALLLDPWVYETIAFDFHTEPLAALFVVLCGRAMWRRRARQALWFAVPAVLCYAPGGLYVAAVGVSALLARRQLWRAALGLVALGMAWVPLLNVAGGEMASGSRFSNANYYAYLIGPKARPVGSLRVGLALLEHPATALAHMAPRWPYLFLYLGVVGLLGLGSPWALPMVLAVFLPSTLAGSIHYLMLEASFQNWPALPFVLVGSVEVLAILAARRRARPAPSAGAVLAPYVGLVQWVVACSLIASFALTRFTSWLAVSPSAAQQLAVVRHDIPSGAEVVASWGISGRFGTRSDVIAYSSPGQVVQVTEPTVVFIFTSSQGAIEAPPSSTLAAERAVTDLGARPLEQGGAVEALIWHHAPEGRDVVLP